MHDFEIKRILVPTDTSEASRVSLDYARLFAEKFAAELIILYADPLAFPIDALTGVPAPFVSTGEDLVLLEKEVRAYADASLAGKSYQVVVIGGQAIPMILHHAHECAADLIVMATHGLRGWRRTILGSVTEGVLHGARCPVLSISRTDRQPHLGKASVTKIVCPVNFTDVARDALRTATQLAERFGCELVIAHVIEGEAVSNKEDDEQRIRRWIAPEVQKNCTYREIVLRGGAAERILDCVEDVGADFLVIGAQHKLLRETTVIGTTTERLIRFARCPVLTVVREVAVAEKVA
jgi:nucleotide-binding universal stress UspA family protein